MAFLSVNGYYGFAIEATRGVAASVSTYYPVTDPKWEPKETWIADNALRGSSGNNYDTVPGVRHDEFTGKVYVFDDLFPGYLRAILGSTDTAASIGGGIYSHTIGLLNNQVSTGNQPPSYSILNFDAYQALQGVAGQLSELNITLGAEAACEATFSWVTNIAASVAIPASNPETAEHLIPGWDVAASIGGVSIPVINSFEMNIKRGTKPIHTIGQQGPYRNWAGPFTVEGKAVVVLESATDQTYLALTRDQQQVMLNLIDPVSGHTVLFQMSAVQLKDPVRNPGKEWMELGFNFVANMNATDAVAGGLSPLKTITTNTVTTAY